ncbi:ribosomal protein S18-alanine N-acetyltransferase [Pseudoalteromonas sp. GB56]
MFEILPLNNDHIAEIMVIENACHTHPWNEKLMLSCLSGRYFARGLFANNLLVAFYVAEQAGPDITLIDICVSPEYQGQGLGKKLMRDSETNAQQRNTELMFLEVRESNTAAFNLYQNCGFDFNGRRKGYYPDGEDALLMMKTVLDDAEI